MQTFCYIYMAEPHPICHLSLDYCSRFSLALKNAVLACCIYEGCFHPSPWCLCVLKRSPPRVYKILLLQSLPTALLLSCPETSESDHSDGHAMMCCGRQQ